MEAKTIRSTILQAMFIALCLVLAPSSVLAQFCPTPLELDVIVLINEERSNAGLQPVVVDVRLVESSRLHSSDMAANDFVSHDGSNGSNFAQRILAAGYPTPRSENIAAGQPTASAVVTDWMDSPGHRANILDSSARHIGVGMVPGEGSTFATYWTSDFGSAGGAPEFPASCGGGGGDVVPPAVSVTSPRAGSTISKTQAFSAIASDNAGVVGVQFFLDGAPIGPEDSLPPYAIQFSTTTVSDGTYALTARARDAAGNQTVSAPVSITINNADAGEPGPAHPPTGPGALDLAIEPSDPGFRLIRAEANVAGVARLELYIDGQLRATASGDALTFDWDVQSLLGSYLVRVDALGAAGTEVLNSTSLFYSVTTTSAPSVSLDVVDFRIIGATFIRAVANVSDATRVELYVDSGLVLVRNVADQIEYAWDPQPGTAHDITFVAYNQTGVVASVTITHVQ